MYKKIKAILPIIMRLGAAGVKFVFLIVISSSGNQSLLGDYAILMILVGLGSQFLGFELNAGVGRTIHSLSKRDQFKLISTQFYFHLVSYIVFLAPFVLSASLIFKLEYKISLIYILVVYVEHLSLEIYRLLVTLLSVDRASYFQFFRTVPFALCLIVVLKIKPEIVSINFVAFSWLLNSLLAILYVVKGKIVIGKIREVSRVLDFSQAVKMVLDTRYLYIISCAGAAVAYGDKIIVLNLLGKVSVGELYYFYSLSSIISLVVSFTVGVKEGPIAIRQYSIGNIAAYQKSKRDLRNKYIIYAAVTSGFLLISFYIAGLLGVNKYLDKFDIFAIIVFSAAISIQTDVAKLDLYLKRNDIRLLVINLFVLCLTITLVYFLTLNYEMHGTAYAVAIVPCVMLILLNIRQKSI